MADGKLRRRVIGIDLPRLCFGNTERRTGKHSKSKQSFHMSLFNGLPKELGCSDYRESRMRPSKMFTGNYMIRGMQFTLQPKFYKHCVIPNGGGFQPTAGSRVEHMAETHAS